MASPGQGIRVLAHGDGHGAVAISFPGAYGIPAVRISRRYDPVDARGNHDTLRTAYGIETGLGFGNGKVRLFLLDVDLPDRACRVLECKGTFACLPGFIDRDLESMDLGMGGIDIRHCRHFPDPVRQVNGRIVEARSHLHLETAAIDIEYEGFTYYLEDRCLTAGHLCLEIGHRRVGPRCGIFPGGQGAFTVSSPLHGAGVKRIDQTVISISFGTLIEHAIVLRSLEYFISQSEITLHDTLSSAGHRQGTDTGKPITVLDPGMGNKFISVRLLTIRQTREPCQQTGKTAFRRFHPAKVDAVRNDGRTIPYGGIAGDISSKCAYIISTLDVSVIDTVMNFGRLAAEAESAADLIISFYPSVVDKIGQCAADYLSCKSAYLFAAGNISGIRTMPHIVVIQVSGNTADGGCSLDFGFISGVHYIPQTLTDDSTY